MEVLTFNLRRPWRHWLSFLMVRSVALLLFAATAFHTHGQTSREQQLKGVLLFNLIQFVEWPASAFADAQSPFIIAVLGNDSFAALLEEVVRNEMVNQRRIVVERYRPRAPIGPCHLLFVGTDRSLRLSTTLERIKTRPVLTVSDLPQFIDQGGMLRLFRNEEDKIRIQVNLAAVKANHLNISAKLLRVAEVVGPPAPIND